MTTSIDLVQTNFKCCAINSHLNYDMSLWRLQNYGPNFVVPKTCCILANDQDGTNYLDPAPGNLTLCQSLLKYEYNRARHKESCIEHLVAFYTQHYTIFLTGAAIFGLVQIFVILSVIFSCIKMHKRKRAIVRSTGTTMQTNVLTNNKRPAPQPQFQQPINNIHAKPTSITRYSYNLSNSYLVWIIFLWNISNNNQNKISKTYPKIFPEKSRLAQEIRNKKKSYSMSPIYSVFSQWNTMLRKLQFLSEILVLLFFEYYFFWY